MKKIFLGISSLIIFLGACSSEPKSVEYFKDAKNQKELEDTMKYCLENQDVLENKKNSKEYIECKNAHQASFAKSMGNKPLSDVELRKQAQEKAKALFGD